MGKIRLNNPKPFYQQLIEIIKSQIASGIYEKGNKLPIEVEIAKKYKVSLVTVRKALNILVKDNLIYRRPRLGTFIHKSNIKTNTNMLNCLKINHLHSTEDVDSKIKETFKRENTDFDIKFQTVHVSCPEDIHLLSLIKNADVLVMNTGWFNKLYELKMVLNLSKYLMHSREISQNGFFRNAIKPFERNNKIYAIPQNFNITMLYCNKKLFDKKGIDPLKEKWDWENFEKLINELTVKSSSGETESYGFGYFRYPAVFWENFIYQAEGKIFDKSYSHFLIDSPESKKAIKFLQKLTHKKESVIRLNPILEHVDFLLNGRVAMIMEGTSLIHTLRNKLDEWLVLPLPKDKISNSIAVSYGVGISKYSKHKKAAWKFIESYCGTFGQSVLGAKFTDMPALRKTARESFIKSDKRLGNSEAFLLAARDTTPFPYLLYYEKVKVCIDNALDRILSGEKNLDSILSSLKIDVENSLTYYRTNT